MPRHTSGDYPNVYGLPASTTFTVNQALDSARTLDLAEVLIIGVDNDGHLAVRSSRMDRRDALWLLEMAKDYTRTPSD
jgi:hypothetical protein